MHEQDRGCVGRRRRRGPGCASRRLRRAARAPGAVIRAADAAAPAVLHAADAGQSAEGAAARHGAEAQPPTAVGVCRGQAAGVARVPRQLAALEAHEQQQHVHEAEAGLGGQVECERLPSLGCGVPRGCHVGETWRVAGLQLDVTLGLHAFRGLAELGVPALRLELVAAGRAGRGGRVGTGLWRQPPLPRW